MHHLLVSKATRRVMAVVVVGGDIELQMGILKKTCRTDGLY